MLFVGSPHCPAAQIGAEKVSPISPAKASAIRESHQKWSASTSLDAALTFFKTSCQLFLQAVRRAEDRLRRDSDCEALQASFTA
mmetsp:Transcript_7012/g.15317  ORF Transcript_7012/g.15317 Transcript_7012/m.15317 type:complete len:84 (+) Transcript_7012:894-1145(+)